MTNQLEALIAEMKAAAEKATPLQLDTAQIVRGNGGSLECPCCEGAGYVEEEKDFCNIDGEPLGVQFYGIGGSFGLAESYFRQVAPKNILTLIAAMEQSQQQNKELQTKIEATEAVALALRDDSRSKDKRIAELEASKIPAKGVYASRKRQLEVNAAHARKLMRKRRRSVGKSNKNGFRFTAEMRVALICDMNFWALICRSNRKQEVK